MIFFSEEEIAPKQDENEMSDESSDETSDEENQSLLKDLGGAPIKDFEKCSPKSQKAKLAPLLEKCREYKEKFKISMPKLLGNVYKRHLNTTDDPSENDPLLYDFFDQLSKGKNPLQEDTLDPRASLKIAEDCKVGQKKWDKLRGYLPKLKSRYSLDKLRKKMYPKLEELDTGYWLNLGTAVTGTLQSVVETEELELEKDEEYVADCDVGLDASG